MTRNNLFILFEPGSTFVLLLPLRRRRQSPFRPIFRRIKLLLVRPLALVLTDPAGKI